MRTRDYGVYGWDLSWRAGGAGDEEAPAPLAAAPEEAPLPEFAVDYPEKAAAPAAIEPAVFAYAGRTTANGIPLEDILRDRPDVYAAYFREFNGPNNDHHSSAWMNRVGGASPEAYANYWYETFGKTEYVWTPHALAPEGETPQGSGRYTFDGLSIDQLLRDRPDVYQAYFEAFYGPNNDPHSSAWLNRVGGTTVEDYANYWYETFGRNGEYGPSMAAAKHAAQVGVTITDEGISLQEILSDRPDVYRAFFREYYGPHNDRHSSAWLDRVGGETPEAYANYWYKTFAKAEGYVPTSLRPPPPPERAPPPPAPDAPPVDNGPPIPGTDALGNPLPPPPVVETPEAPPVESPADDVAPLVETDDLGNPLLPPPSGEDIGGLYLPAT